MFLFSPRPISRRFSRAALSDRVTFSRMTLSRARMLMSTIAVATLLLYGASHGLHRMSTDEAMAGAVTSLCVLLVTVLAVSPAQRPETDHELRPGDQPAARFAWPTGLAVDRKARASPRTLQRFRN